MKFFVSFLTAWIVTCCAQSNPLHAVEREDFFEEKIRPLLISRCTECHGALVKEGELQLHHQAAAFTGGTSGKAIIPGNATNSLLYQVVSQTHDSISMPPDDSLTNDEIANLRKWITDGAVWPVSKIEFFQRSIFNTLNKSCVKCHDERQKSGGLSLVSRDH